jgi:hypothetical protein
MSAYHVLQAQLAAQDRRQLLTKCIAIGALSQEQGAKVKARIDAREADDVDLAKSLRPGPSLTEIVKQGYFSELPQAPFQP